MIWAECCTNSLYHPEQKCLDNHEEFCLKGVMVVNDNGSTNPVTPQRAAKEGRYESKSVSLALEIYFNLLKSTFYIQRFYFFTVN